MNTSGFHYYLRVRYGECDAQKVVFNSRYGDYIDLAALEFIRALGFGKEVISGELDYQLVRQTIEWKGPARYDQVLDLFVEPSQLGTTSFRFRTEIRQAGDPHLLVTSETVYVMVDTHTLIKEPLPAAFRAALERGIAQAHVDHAGYLPGVDAASDL